MNNPKLKLLIETIQLSTELSENLEQMQALAIERQDVIVNQVLPSLLEDMQKLEQIVGRNHKGELRSYTIRPRDKKFFRGADGMIRFYTSHRGRDVLLVIDDVLDFAWAKRNVRPTFDNMMMTRLHVTIEELMEQLNNVR